MHWIWNGDFLLLGMGLLVSNKFFKEKRLRNNYAGVSEWSTENLRFS